MSRAVDEQFKTEGFTPKRLFQTVAKRTVPEGADVCDAGKGQRAVYWIKGGTVGVFEYTGEPSWIDLSGMSIKGRVIRLDSVVSATVEAKIHTSESSFGPQNRPDQWWSRVLHLRHPDGDFVVEADVPAEQVKVEEFIDKVLTAISESS